MKLIIGTVVSILLISGLAFGESAISGWQANAGPTPGVGVVQRITLEGPSLRNKMPDSQGPFDGEFVFAPAWGTQLMAVHLVKAAQDWTLATQPVKFEVETTESDRDPAYRRTRFKTESLDFDEGDLFVFLFKTDKRTEMVTARISKKFVPM